MLLRLKDYLIPLTSIHQLITSYYLHSFHSILFVNFPSICEWL